MDARSADGNVDIGAVGATGGDEVVGFLEVGLAEGFYFGGVTDEDDGADLIADFDERIVAVFFNDQDGAALMAEIAGELETLAAKSADDDVVAPSESVAADAVEPGDGDGDNAEDESEDFAGGSEEARGLNFPVRGRFGSVEIEELEGEVDAVVDGEMFFTDGAGNGGVGVDGDAGVADKAQSEDGGHPGEDEVERGEKDAATAVDSG